MFNIFLIYYFVVPFFLNFYMIVLGCLVYAYFFLVDFLFVFLCFHGFFLSEEFFCLVVIFFVWLV